MSDSENKIKVAAPSEKTFKITTNKIETLRRQSLTLFENPKKEAALPKRNSIVFLESKPASNELLPNFLREKLVPKCPLYNDKGFLSPELLREAGIKFRQSLNYVMSEILDEGQNKYVSLDEALYMGILSEKTKEFIDSRDGSAMPVVEAIKKNKIKIAEFVAAAHPSPIETPKPADEDINQTLHNLTRRINSVETLLPAALTRSTTNEDSLALSSGIEMTNSSSTSLRSHPAKFNLVECLVYKKPTNGKYIRFEKVIKYDAASGRIKDLNTLEYVSIYEAFKRDLLMLNDPNSLFDETSIYKVDTVLTTAGKKTLAHAVNKKIIDQNACSYKFLSHVYPMGEAMKEGFIEGRIVSYAELKLLLDEFADRLTARVDSDVTISEKSKMSDKEPNSSSIRTNTYLKRTLEKFVDFYIFDGDTECYISLHDAFYKGTIIGEPVRIMEPNSGNYILLRNAVVKGLMSCQPSKTKVLFKNRSSFFTFNRVSYIIDGIYDGQMRTLHSLQDATKFGLFKNGLYKCTSSREEWLPIEQAILMGYIVGKQVDLDEIDELFKKMLAVPPSKPTRGIFIEHTSNKPSPDCLTKSSTKQSLDSAINEKENNYSKVDSVRFVSDHSLSKSGSNCDENYYGRIELVKDFKKGRYLSLEEAIASKIINFSKGFLINTETNNTIDILTAIEHGYIILDYQAANFVKNNQRSRSLSQSSRRTTMSTSKSNNLNESNLIKVGRQFVITGVFCPTKKVNYVSENF